MRTRLVVGRGRLARDVVEQLRVQRDELIVVSDSRRTVESLLEADVSVERGDPTDPNVLERVGPVDSVLALHEDASTNAELLAAAASVFPDAFTLGYLGLRSTAEEQAAVRERADKVLDPGQSTYEALTDRLGEAAARMRLLRRVIDDIDGRLAVVTHDNPDPDAIASAIALKRIANAVGCEADACYYGAISHQENRAFVNLLDIDLENLDGDTDLSEYAGIALVDHSRPSVNDQLPADTKIDIVVDHHPPRGPVDATYADLRADVGATSTLMVEYFRQFGLELEETIATALLFGIRVDTDEFSREVSVVDYEAAAELVKHADLGTLQRIENPSMDPETLDTIADAITNRTQQGPVLISGVGQLVNRDALAQSADRLLNMEGVNTTLVHGIADGTVYISARARGTDIDLGEALRDAFGQIGSAGGHADMAGAQIELGVMDAVESDDESLASVVHQVICDRFLEVLESRWNRQREFPADDYMVTTESLSLLGGDGPAE